MSGAFDYGPSYHSVAGTDHVITGGASYDIGQYYTAAAGFEVIDGSSTETGYFGSITADYGNYGGVLSVSMPTGAGTTALGIWANYSPIQDLELTAGYLSAYGDEICSLGAEYTFMQNGYIGGSVLGSGVSDLIYTAYVGWNINFGG